MNYRNVIQTPDIQNNKVVGWTLRVEAEQDGYIGAVEEYVAIPLAEQQDMSAWTPEKLATLLTETSTSRNMLYRAADKVMSIINKITPAA